VRDEWVIGHKQREVAYNTPSVRVLHVCTCSSLYCLLFCHEDGVFALGSASFAEQAQSEFHDALDRYNTSESGARYPARPVKVAVPVHKDMPSIVLTKLEEYVPCQVVIADVLRG
jgi:hypothetical protein